MTELPPHLRKPRLRRHEAAEYLRLVHGVEVAVATLNKWASVGGGPVFERVNRTPLYPTQALDSWVAKKIGGTDNGSTDMGIKALDRIPAHKWRGIEPVLKKGRLMGRCVCSVCGGHEELPVGAISADAAVKRAVQAGWSLRGKMRCPSCIETKKERGMGDATAQVQPQKVQPSEAAKRAKRLIYMALEDYYDDNAKRYRPGHSDESVAKEVGASVEFVRSIREADFGPLSEPDEITGLRQRLDGAVKAALDALAVADALKVEMKKLCDRNGWA